jgi:hypothetical protein
MVCLFVCLGDEFQFHVVNSSPKYVLGRSITMVVGVSIVFMASLVPVIAVKQCGKKNMNPFQIRAQTNKQTSLAFKSLK